ncbi:MAG TPA: glycosyltransferase family 2 protein [Ktedonobacterales bacterium]|jgi:dolichol-phosphate mannosyltransferase
MSRDEKMRAALDTVPETAAMGAQAAAAPKRTRIQRVLLVLPALNEAGKIGATISKTPAGVVHTILVVDDCSTDGTGAEAAALGAVVIRHAQNMGVGAAIRTGIYYARDHGYDVVVVAASDDQDIPAEIPRLLEPIEQGRAEFVQGSRYLRGGRRVHHPLSRTFMTWGYSALFTLIAFRRVTDGTNGFRAFLTDTALSFPLGQEWLNRYELEPYLYFRCLQKGVAVEVPATKVYPLDRKIGYTKMRPFRDWWRIFRPLLLVRLGIRR